MGRGEYYRNKYGGGGRGGGRGGRGDGRENAPSYSDSYRGRGGGGRGRDGGWRNYDATSGAQEGGALPTLTWAQLGQTLRDIHNRSYNAYHDLERGLFAFSERGLAFQLGFDYVQGDPYASASRAHVLVEAAAAQFPREMWSATVRNVALCDYLTRRFAESAHKAGADAKTST
jgi:hypothetical protein